MAGRIPQQFIDDLLSRTDIIDVIDSRVPLRKAGRDHQARCPFHEEKTPSFTVSQNKQFYHCFGCGANGTAISFLMEYEHLDFIEALKELAKQAGVELPSTTETSPSQKQIPDLAAIMLQATSYYRDQLRNHPDKHKAVDYLKNRGLSGEVAAKFEIGFAPPGWDNLTRLLGQNKTTIELEQLISTGMTVCNDDKRTYDRFRNRIMFPIKNRTGKVIGFGGRVLDDNDKPKYLNSPESPLFHKGRELYGLYEVRQSLRHINRLFVVEGYMDVVALAQYGINNAVATLGTALTIDHLQPLFRSCDDVIFCFDGDKAGRDAAWKALDTVLPEIYAGRQARFMFLPDGDDPDTLVQKEGREAFLARADNAVALSSFLFDNLAKEIDLNAIDGRSRLVELARPKLNKVTNKIYRLLLIEELAKRIRMDSNTLIAQIEGNQPRFPNNPRHNATNNRKPSAIRKAITLLLNQPSLAQEITQAERYLTLNEPGINLLVDLLTLLQDRPSFSCGAILEHWHEHPNLKHLRKLAQEPLEMPQEGIQAEFLGAMALLNKQRLEQEMASLLHKEQTGSLNADDKRRFIELLTEKNSTKTK